MKIFKNLIANFWKQPDTPLTKPEVKASRYTCPRCGANIYAMRLITGFVTKSFKLGKATIRCIDCKHVWTLNAEKPEQILVIHQVANNTRSLAAKTS